MQEEGTKTHLAASLSLGSCSARSPVWGGPAKHQHHVNPAVSARRFGCHGSPPGTLVPDHLKIKELSDPEHNLILNNTIKQQNSHNKRLHFPQLKFHKGCLTTESWKKSPLCYQCIFRAFLAFSIATAVTKGRRYCSHTIPRFLHLLSFLHCYQNFHKTERTC